MTNQMFTLDQRGRRPSPLERSDDVREVAERVMQEAALDIRPARVQYLEVRPCISKTRAARIIKCSEELAHFSGADYLIEVSADLWELLSADLRDPLILHQLMQIHPVMNEKTGDWIFKLRRPDVQAFKRVIDAHGTGWEIEIRTQLASIYNLTPAQEDQVRV